jgi:hypothetical protein
MHAGGHAAIIVMDKDYNRGLTDDGTGWGINIPTVSVNSTFGEALFEYLNSTKKIDRP